MFDALLQASALFHLARYFAAALDPMGYPESEKKVTPRVYITFGLTGNWLPKPLNLIDGVQWLQPEHPQKVCRLLNANLKARFPEKGSESYDALGRPLEFTIHICPGACE